MLIRASYTISMGHRLPSYKGVCSSPHGHNVTVNVSVNALDKEFLDFKKLSGALKALLLDFDHSMVLHDQDPLAKILKEWTADGQRAGFRTVELNVEPTTEAIAQYIFNTLINKFDVVSVEVQETAKYSAICRSLNTDIRRTG